LKVALSSSSKQATLPESERAYNERLNLTLSKISRILDVDFRHNPFRSLRRRFVVAHTPRVGSHLLCEQLLDYGAVVEEFFELPRIRGVSRKNNFVSIEEFCDWLLEKYALAGVFGVSGGVKALAPLVLAGEIPEFISDWRFVHLTREDFVARAVSELIARLTGAFKSSRAPAKIVSDDDYDAAMLRRLIDGTLTFNAAWEGAFKTYGVEPYRLTYETLCADPASAVADVAAHLRLDGTPVREDRFLAPKLEKQATSLNARWAERFRAENQAFCAARASADFVPHEVRAQHG
jgi:LPS sulfotransferase NodH